MTQSHFFSLGTSLGVWAWTCSPPGSTLENRRFSRPDLEVVLRWGSELSKANDSLIRTIQWPDLEVVLRSGSELSKANDSLLHTYVPYVQWPDFEVVLRWGSELSKANYSLIRAIQWPDLEVVLRWGSELSKANNSLIHKHGCILILKLGRKKYLTFEWNTLYYLHT
jgi:hypothetical protein